MAQAWTYSDWRTYSAADRRDRLILHIQEVEDRLSGLEELDSGGQRSKRFEMDALLSRLERHLKTIESELGLSASGASESAESFVEARPRYV